MARDNEAGTPLTDALRTLFISPNVLDLNLEPANIVDALADIGNAVRNGLISTTAPGAEDRSVTLVDAIGELSYALRDIARAIGDVAEVLRDTEV